MLNINMQDVYDVLASVQYYLIAIAAVLIIGIAVIVVVKGMDKSKKALIRKQAAAAMLLTVVIILNLICVGPMSTLLDLSASGGGNTVTAETESEARALVTEICEEGITLLENDGVLPLASSKLNVFGWASTVPIYGGTGSGALNDQYHTVDLLEGLSNAGIEYNTALTGFYQDYATERGAGNMFAQDWTMPEPNVSLYTGQMLSEAKDYSDTAMIVIGRAGGEGYDLPHDMAAVVAGTFQADNTSPGADHSAYAAASYDDALNAGSDWDEGDHYLQLNNREEELIDLVCQNFNKVILIYNGANPFELGFVEDYDQIKSVLWVSGAGQNGFDALGSILSGAVNPSGRMVDTYIYELKSAPWWNNFGGAFYYTNMNEFAIDDNTWMPGAVPSFINYVEGIYVGYKFYETAALEDLIDYDATVQYPFGYGLSYTTFSQEITSSSADGGLLSLEVTVTNTGNVAGKDVVEVFYAPPYVNGGIEKSAVNLIEYAKTGPLDPGESQTLTITFSVEDMASYDSKVNGCYVLDAGDYVISINSDAHTVIDSFVYTQNSTVVFGGESPRASDDAPAVNRFDYASDAANGFVTLSRADGFSNYAQATAAPAVFEMNAENKAGFYNNSNYLTAEATADDEDPDAEFPTTGKASGLTMTDMRGLDYDDPKWEIFLDQLSLSDMNTLISLGGYQTPAIESIGKIRSNDCDGPASINNNFTKEGSLGFPACVMVATTWNKDLAHRYGESIGKMADEMDTSGWYAPATNIHRTAFAGRNFEYYSEDPVLSGHTASSELAGAWKFGVYGYLKHFALNDAEANRCSVICTYVDEQAIREIYLKPFEIAVKSGNCRAIMSTFAYVGNRWGGGDNNLCNAILRDEWGFRGMVLTDYFGGYGYMSADQAIRNGGDFCLTNHDIGVNNVQFQATAGAQQAMRQASKNILYVTCNSRSYAAETVNSMPLWQVVLIAVDLMTAAIIIAIEESAFRKYRRDTRR